MSTNQLRPGQIINIFVLCLILLIPAACSSVATSSASQATRVLGTRVPSTDQAWQVPPPLTNVTPPPFPDSPITSTDQAILAAKATLPDLVEIIDTPELEIGKSMDIVVVQSEAPWRLIFWKGWGDCPSGCLNHHYWYVSVTSNGVVTLEGQFEKVFNAKLNESQTSGQPLWGVPY